MLSRDEMEYSPAPSATSDLTDEELDRYFATYVPLSNLPTPPLPKQREVAPDDISSTSRIVHSSPEHQAYASHLASLVPSNVSTHRAHAHIVQGFLARAGLPDEVVAFAACVLDALSPRFAGAWRAALAPSDYARDVRNFLRTDAPCAVHVSPDVIVLAALALAHGFLADRLRCSRHWSVKESQGMFTVQEIEATQRAMLADLDYGLFRISESMVQGMLREMRGSDEADAEPQKQAFAQGMDGSAVWSYGVPTPEPSP